VSGRQSEPFTVLAGIPWGEFRKIFKIFEKSKNAGNCLKSTQNQIFLKILKFFKIPPPDAMLNRYLSDCS
jgi:hypothetical protein